MQIIAKMLDITTNVFAIIFTVLLMGMPRKKKGIIYKYFYFYQILVLFVRKEINIYYWLKTKKKGTKPRNLSTPQVINSCMTSSLARYCLLLLSFLSCFFYEHNPHFCCDLHYCQDLLCFFHCLWFLFFLSFFGCVLFCVF